MTSSIGAWPTTLMYLVQFLNNLNMKLLTPALIFSKIALSLSPEKLVSIAVVPLG